MRTTFWNTYTSNSFFLLYSAYSGILQNTLRRYYGSQCRPPFCPIPDPENYSNGVRIFLNNGVPLLPDLENYRNSISSLLNQENLQKEEEEAPITDIVIPMGLYLPNLVETTQVLFSTSSIPYSQYYSLYHFWRKHLVHLD